MQDNINTQALSVINSLSVGSEFSTRTGAGAIDVTSFATSVVTTAADALTLANGKEGQVKVIFMTTDGGDGTLTPVSLLGYTTITFNTAGDAVILQFLNAKWVVISNQGATLA